METIAAVRLFFRSVAGRASASGMRFALMESNADSGDDRAEVSIAAGGESSRGRRWRRSRWRPTVRRGCHAGVAGREMRRRPSFSGETIGSCGLIVFPLSVKRFTTKRKIAARNEAIYLLVAREPSSERVLPSPGGWNRA